MVQAVATTLGVIGQPGRTVEQSVHGHLARRRVLIVLDNCEHVLGAAATFVGNLLAACPQVSVLSTSRERLGVTGERVVAVNPLSTDRASDSDAVRLFVERARSQDPSFADESDAVARLCVRLDGLPLAIELAAARVASVGAPALLDATTDRLRLLAGGQGRHRSLRAVLDWSHDLLGEAEQRLLRRLGVFANGFDLAAVVTVAGDDGDPAAVIDTLGHLVDKNPGDAPTHHRRPCAATPSTGSKPAGKLATRRRGTGRGRLRSPPTSPGASTMGTRGPTSSTSLLMTYALLSSSRPSVRT